MIKLLGLAVVLVGFACRVNPLLIVVLAALSTGVAAGQSWNETLTQFGAAFVRNR